MIPCVRPPIVVLYGTGFANKASEFRLRPLNDIQVTLQGDKLVSIIAGSAVREFMTKQAIRTPGRPWNSRFTSVLRGGAAGMIVGSVWTALIGPLTDGPPSIGLSFVVYTTTLTCTGLVVGAVQRLPALIGLGMGWLTLSIAAIIVGPKDGWMLLWLMVFGGSGVICGPMVGGLFLFLRRRFSAGTDAGLDRGE